MTSQEAQRSQLQSKRDRATEQKRRDEKCHDEAGFRPDLEDHRVLSFKEWCALCGFSAATGRRVIAAGIGPIVTQLSARRIGVSIANHLAWQASRARGVA